MVFGYLLGHGLLKDVGDDWTAWSSIVGVHCCGDGLSEPEGYEMLPGAGVV